MQVRSDADTFSALAGGCNAMQCMQVCISRVMHEFTLATSVGCSLNMDWCRERLTFFSENFTGVTGHLSFAPPRVVDTRAWLRWRQPTVLALDVDTATDEVPTTVVDRDAARSQK